MVLELQENEEEMKLGSVGKVMEAKVKEGIKVKKEHPPLSFPTRRRRRWPLKR